MGPLKINFRFITIIMLAGVFLLISIKKGRAEIDLSGVERSVGHVYCSVKKDTKAGPVTFKRGIGSGFVVSNEGHFVTNAHVMDFCLEQNGELEIYFSDSDFESDTEILYVEKEKIPVDLNGKVLVFYKQDIGILKLSPFDSVRHPPLCLVTFDLVEKGEAVWTVGYPGISEWAKSTERSKNDPTVSKGVIQLKVANSAFGQLPLFQIDAEIHKGNSGGPLVNECGQVLGINTLKPAFEHDITHLAFSANMIMNQLDRMNIRYSKATIKCYPNISFWLYPGLAIIVLAVFGALVIKKHYQRQNKKEEVAVNWQQQNNRPGHFRAYLISLNKPEPGARYLLQKPIVIGRSPKAANIVFSKVRYKNQPNSRSGGI